MGFYNVLTLYLILICLLFNPLQTLIYADEVCPEYKFSNNTCKICLLPENDTSVLVDSPVSKLLVSYLNYTQIKINANKDFMKWNYNNEAVVEARHMKTSFYFTQNDENGSSLVLLRGCCNIPLKKKQCSSNDILDGTTLYFSLTLFRSTIIQKDKQFTREEDITRNTIHLEDTATSLGDENPFSSTGTLSSSSRNLTPETLYSSTTSNQLLITSTTHAKIGVEIHEQSPEDNGVVEDWLEYTRSVEADDYSYVCLFELSKDIVLKHKTRPAAYDTTSEQFQRGVFNMPGFSYNREEDFQIRNKTEIINCTTRTFEGETVFNSSFSNSNNNNTFTCMILWLTVNVSDEVETKCMPHNVTYGIQVGSDESIDPINATFINTVAIGCSGGLIIFIIILIGLRRWHYHIKKFIRSTKELPVTFNVTFADINNFAFEDKFSEREIPTVFDENERIHIGQLVSNSTKSCSTTTMKLPSNTINILDFTNNAKKSKRVFDDFSKLQNGKNTFEINSGPDSGMGSDSYTKEKAPTSDTHKTYAKFYEINIPSLCPHSVTPCRSSDSGLPYSLDDLENDQNSVLEYFSNVTKVGQDKNQDKEDPPCLTTKYFVSHKDLCIRNEELVVCKSQLPTENHTILFDKDSQVKSNVNQNDLSSKDETTFSHDKQLTPCCKFYETLANEVVHTVSEHAKAKYDSTNSETIISVEEISKACGEFAFEKEKSIPQSIIDLNQGKYCRNQQKTVLCGLYFPASDFSDNRMNLH